jgi:hypothetical protein
MDRLAREGRLLELGNYSEGGAFGKQAHLTLLLGNPSTLFAVRAVRRTRQSVPSEQRVTTDLNWMLVSLSAVPFVPVFHDAVFPINVEELGHRE